MEGPEKHIVNHSTAYRIQRVRDLIHNIGAFVGDNERSQEVRDRWLASKARGWISFLERHNHADYIKEVAEFRLAELENERANKKQALQSVDDAIAKQQRILKGKPNADD